MKENIKSYLDETAKASKMDTREQFYKRCEGIVLDYVSGNLKHGDKRIEKFKRLEDIDIEQGMAFIARDCDVVKVISPCEAASVMQELFDNGTDKTQAAAKAADLLKNMFSDIAFLSSIGTLQSLFGKKEEVLKKQGLYKSLLLENKDLSNLVVYLGRKGDTALKEIENDFSVKKENIKCLLNRNDLFNVRCLGQNKTVGLSPEGFRLFKYINKDRQDSSSVYQAN